MSKRIFLIATIVFCAGFLGCEMKQPDLYKNEPATTTTAPSTESPAPAATPATTAEPTGPAAPVAATPEKKDEDNFEVVKADVGVGKKGRYETTGGPADFVTVPVATLFAAKEMVAFRMQIPHSLNLYKASHDGNPPKDYEEFKREILEPSAIQLPELPEGAEYIYDPTGATPEDMFKVKRRKR